jgi:hypothetical protein
VTFLRTTIDHNNYEMTQDPTWEAGGGKVSNSQNVTFDACVVHDNGGPGIWFDQTNGTYNPGAWVKNCRVYDNAYAGIMIEVTDGGDGTPILVENNVVYRIGRWRGGIGDTRGWYWPSAILISSSKYVEVRGNTVWDSLCGISAISQDRADRPPGGSLGINFHDNYVILLADTPGDGSEKALLSFAEDFPGLMYTTGLPIPSQGSANHFWSAYAEPRWDRFGQWDGTALQTLADLNSHPIGGSSVMLSDAEKDAQLAAVGLP